MDNARQKDKGKISKNILLVGLGIAVVYVSFLLPLFSWAGERMENMHSVNTITVTAQKVEEDVQNIPISMTVLSNIDLEDREIWDLEDMAYYIPNFYFLNLSDVGSCTPSMRGLMAISESFSSTVGLYIDGVPTTNNIGFNTVLTDIERVEVLRGPQGTLYGKNTEAGVINVVTKKPGNQVTGKISGSYGEDNRKEVNFIYNIPIIKNKFYFTTSGRYYQKDGFLKNTLTGDYDDERKNYFGKVNFLFMPTDRLEMRFVSSLYKTDNGTFSLNSKTAKNLREYQTDFDGFMKFSDESHALKIKYAFDWGNMESITAYRKSTDERRLDYDFSPIKFYHLVNMHMPHKTISEELKLSGTRENLKWLVGFFGSNYKKTGGHGVESINPKFAGRFDSSLEEESYGIFTHITYCLNNKWNVIGGIRYNRDTRKLEDFAYKYSGSDNFTNILPRFAIEYKLNDNSSIYTSVAKGYKSGGFFILAPDGYPKKYDDETLWNYEFGIKNTLMNEKLTINFAGYYMDISDMQVVSVVNAFAGYLSNAASATSKGLEFDVNYFVNNNFSIFCSLGYNETKFENFKDSKGDYSGNTNPFAPKYNYSVGAKFRSAGGVYVSGDISGYGEMYMDNANLLRNNAYNLVNTKIGYEWDKFDLYLYADNLFDKCYDLIGYFGQNAILSPPREIGIKLTFRF